MYRMVNRIYEAFDKKQIGAIMQIITKPASKSYFIDFDRFGLSIFHLLEIDDSQKT